MAIFTFQDRWFKPLTHPSGFANVAILWRFLVVALPSVAAYAAICKPIANRPRNIGKELTPQLAIALRSLHNAAGFTTS